MSKQKNLIKPSDEKKTQIWVFLDTRDLAKQCAKAMRTDLGSFTEQALRSYIARHSRTEKGKVLPGYYNAGNGRK